MLPIQVKEEPIVEGNEVGSQLEAFAQKKRPLTTPVQPKQKRVKLLDWFDKSKVVETPKKYLDAFATPPREVLTLDREVSGTRLRRKGGKLVELSKE